MILGFSSYASSLLTQNDVGKVQAVELDGDVVFDELHLSNNLNLGRDISKESWGASTVILATFNETLEAGSILMGEQPVETLRVDRKEIGSENIVTLGKMDYDASNPLNIFVDKTAAPLRKYQYIIYPMIGNVEGSPSSSIVETNIDSAVLIGADKRYYLEYNFSISSVTSIQPNSVIETIGNRRTPFVVYHGGLNYKQGSLNCILIADEESPINLYEERILREKIVNFLTDKKAKILKTNDGFYMLVSIIGEPKVTNEGRAGLYSVEAEFVEVGDPDNQMDLYQNGFVEVAP